jgi:hypothetical protein
VISVRCWLMCIRKMFPGVLARVALVVSLEQKKRGQANLISAGGRGGAG